MAGWNTHWLVGETYWLVEEKTHWLVGEVHWLVGEMHWLAGWGDAMVQCINLSVLRILELKSIALKVLLKFCLSSQGIFPAI